MLQRKLLKKNIKKFKDWKSTLAAVLLACFTRASHGLLVELSSPVACQPKGGTQQFVHIIEIPLFKYFIYIIHFNLINLHENLFFFFN